MPRSLSVTPDASRRRQSMTDEFLVGGVSSYIVRVVMEKADSCVYKSLLVSSVGIFCLYVYVCVCVNFKKQV